MTSDIRYSERIVEIAGKAAEQAASDQELIEVIGCNERTFYRWMNTKPEFKEAVEQGRAPKGTDEAIDKLKQRKQWIEDWLDDTLKNQGRIVEEITTCRLPNGGEQVIKVRRGTKPDLKLIQYVLGVNPEPETFKLTIDIAEPEPEENESELS